MIIDRFLKIILIFKKKKKKKGNFLNYKNVEASKNEFETSKS